MKTMSEGESDLIYRQRFLQDSFRLITEIESKKSELIFLLCRYESHETALDEIDRSIRTLKGFVTEFSLAKSFKSCRGVSVFFPINLPLYSLILFAVAPSIFSKRIFVRPPLVVKELLEDIVKCIRLDVFIENIELHCVTRREFLSECVLISEVVIFNGRYENVQELIKEFPAKTFIYNGRGINPAIVGPDANIEVAIDKIIRMRVFNSGQDCAGVDAIFVADSSYGQFIQGLKEYIPLIPVGDYANSDVKIGKMQRPEYILELEEFLLEVDDFITFRGNIDKKQNIVTPYVIERELIQHSGDFLEFFGPIFYILRYHSETELLGLLNTKYYSDYAMYASVFGTSVDFNAQIPNTRVIINKNINDVEIGNDAYGGYGPKANFFYKDYSYRIGPVLISKDLSTLKS